ncbi:nSTAND1 domain-containing NTPase [Streptomyces doebereineriae]|uniref:Helix-turn-helix domain-containing protein n=1 Tax=Streptomyces doebereineriae TaxID=3075528 RepID=A0ABU2V1Q9_9ACTN|nr:helix-turn-helix domain-containing protein [Streptomyces sp. DSM 41640]MDT0479494.1 helix-turn-helix domain-containing protein [Streptomyces sp. DSM 41640]
MGRPERPVDPDAGPVQRFAHELRLLRQKAGSPSYREMSQHTGVSVTTLSRAAAGERLPSAAVTRAYAVACDVDPDEWEARWKEAAAEAAGVQAAARDVTGTAEDDAKSPYRGLARFEPGDRELFFGRDRPVAELLELVREHRFAAVFGASGSGKSSLLRAGLIPAVQEATHGLGRPAALRILTPGERPAATYGHLLAPKYDESDTWLIVDQFEEVFTLCRDRAERTRFIDLLLAARAPDSRLRTVIAMRADFYGRCAEHPELTEALRRCGLLVGPMSPAELREAVTGPATAAGLVVERELTSRLVEEVVDQPGALPMLSHALLETWRRRRGRILTLAAYEAAGGVHGAIAATAERAYGTLTPAQEGAARRLLLRLIAPGEGTPDTRRSATRAELDEWSDPELPVVVERLAAARLLTLDGDTVELAHEALISSWPRLSRWIDEDRVRLVAHRRLAEDARAWQELGRDPGALYRGVRLDRAAELFAPGAQPPCERSQGEPPPAERSTGAPSPGERSPGEPSPDARQEHLTSTERAFLIAALDARDAERHAVARTRRRTRRLAATLSGLLAVALAISLVAWQQHRTEVRDDEDTAARRVAAVSDTMRTTDPRTAMLLSLAAWRIAPLPETRAALLDALAQPERDAFTDPAQSDTSARFLVGSGRVLLTVDGRTWRTWNTVTHRALASGRLPTGTSRAFAADRDGRLLELDGAWGERLWDLSSGRWAGPAPVSSQYLLSFDADPRSYLVSAIEQPRQQLHAVSDGRLLFEARADSETNVAATADGRLVAVCPVSGPLQVRDLASHRDLAGAWTSAGANTCGDDNSRVEFDPRGHLLAAVSDTDVHVWDTASGQQVADIAYPEAASVSFSEDGGFLAASGPAELAVWRLSAPDAPVFRHSLNDQRPNGAIAWDPDRPEVRYLEGGTVHTLAVGPATTSAWRGTPLNAALLSPDGRTLATAEQSDSGYAFRLRDTGDGRLLRTLPAAPLPAADHRAGPVAATDAVLLPLMSFSPDGTAFAYGVSAPGGVASAQSLALWDIARGRIRTTLALAPSPAAAAEFIALGPGGRLLVTVRDQSEGQIGETWDTTTGRRTAVLGDMNPAAAALRPDGRLLVDGDRLTTLPSGAGTTRTLGLGLGEEIVAMAFSPDGSRAAVGDASGRVALWDGSLTHRLGVLPSVFPVPPANGSPEAVGTLAFSPDGGTLAVAGDSGSLQLWNTADQQPLGSGLTTPGEGITSLAFTPDGATLHATSLHVPLQRYPVSPSYAADQICARAGTTLSRAQWRTYIPDASYRGVCPASG